jgi:hypothetical protein
VKRTPSAQRTGSPIRRWATMGLLLVVTLVMVGGLPTAFGSTASLAGDTSSSPRVTVVGPSPDPIQYVQLDSVSNFTPVPNVSPEFFGVNIRADQPFSATDAEYLADTDALTWRYPGGTLGEDYNYTSDTMPATSRPALPNNLSNFATLCASVGCHAILQLPAEIDDPTIDGYDVWYIEHQVTFTVNATVEQGFRPWVWEIGDEPALWQNFTLPWSSWAANPTAKNATPVKFATDAAGIIPAIHHWDSTTPIDAMGGTGANATDDAGWIRAVMRDVGRNATFVSVHSYLEGNAAPPGNDSAFYAPLYKAKNNFGVYLPDIHADILEGCPNCTGTGLLISEAGASNGVTKNSEYESTFPMAMWDAVEVIQSARGNVTSLDSFAYKNEYPGSWVNTTTIPEVLAPDYYLFKDITPYLGSTPLNLSFNATDGGRFEAGGWWSSNDEWSILLVNLDTSDSLEVNLTGTGVLPTHGSISYYDWNGSTTEPVGGSLAWINATTVAPNSMELVTVTPTAPLVPPTAPRGLFVTGYNGTQARISFVQPAGPVTNDTLVYGVPSTTAPFCSITGNLSAGEATEGIMISGLDRYDGHCFAVEAWNAVGVSPLSSFVNVSALYQFPAAPSNPNVGGNTTNTVSLNWTNPGGGGLLNNTIYVYASDACNLVERVSLGGVFNSTTVPGLMPNTNYCFAVQAWNQTGGSPLSSVVFARTVTVPAAPTDLDYADLTGTSVQLNWTNPGGGGLVNDTIYRGVGTGCRSFGNVTSLVGPSETSLVTGLVNGTMYCFAVQAWNDTGGSHLSEPTLVYTPIVPGSPSGLTTSEITTTSIRLGWTDPRGAISNLSIYLGIGGCTFTNVTSVGNATTGWTFTNLTSATEYCFAVQAWNHTGGSALSSADLTATLALPASALTIIDATNDSLTWNWTNPPGSILDDKFDWSAGATCLSAQADDLGGVRSTHTLTGLLPGNEYCAYVEVATLGGLSNASSIVSGWSLLNAPTGLELRSSNATSLTWNWTNPSGTPTHIEFTWGVGRGCSSLQHVILPGVSAVYTLGSLSANSLYCAFVQAIDPSGASNSSVTVFGTTLAVPSSPTDLVATSESSGAVTLRWSNPTGVVVANDTVGYGRVCGDWTTVSSDGAVTMWTVTLLLPSTTYCFAVQAWNSTVASDWSLPLYATTTTSSGVPAVPTNLVVVTTSISSVTLAWGNPYTSDLSNDTILYAPACAGPFVGYTTGGPVNQTTVSSLYPGTPYCFEVEVSNPAGMSATSPSVNATTAGVPDAPSGLSVVGLGTTYAELVWADPPATVNLTLYVSSNGCTTEGAARYSEGAGATTGNASTLEPATTYCVGVQVWTSSGPSSVDFLSLTTPAMPGSTAPPSSSAIPGWAAIAGGLALGLGVAGGLALAYRRPRGQVIEE